jgi:cystathionine gamma-synthase
MRCYQEISSMSKADPHPSGFPPLGQSKPLVPPIYQSSVYTLPDLDTLDLIMNAEADGYIYARDGHPNGHFLAQQILEMENGSWALVCGSGMAAISAALLALIEQGDRIVASNRLYGKTTQLFRDELTRFGVKTVFVDPCDLDEIEAALKEPAKVLFLETMSNPLLRIVDIAAVVKLCKARNCQLIVDNTFATPELIKPLELGAAMVIESLTKMMSGHSDVTLGVVCGRGDLGLQIGPVVSIWGFSANPFDCWLTSRGLATLGIRMKAACHNAAQLALWLREQPGVAQVIYPGLESHPDHALAQRLLGEYPGNMLCFEVKGGRAAVNRFLHNCPEVPFSPSLGNVTTTLSHPALTSHRYVSPAEKRRQGITDGLIRLSVGIEDVRSIQQVMSRGLS